MSLPSCPFSVSSPSPPSIVSLLPPALIVSLPPRPLMMSVPSQPLIVSASAVPSNAAGVCDHIVGRSQILPFACDEPVLHRDLIAARTEAEDHVVARAQ